MYAERWEIGSILTAAWERFKQYAAVVLICVLIAGGVNFCFSLAANLMQQLGPILYEAGLDYDIATAIAMVLQLGVQFVSWLVQTWFNLGMALVMLKAARGMDPSVGDLFGVARFYLPGLLATVLVGLATAAGLCLLIVPGVIIALGTMLYMFCIVDQNLGPIECIKESWRLTDGDKIRLFLWGLVCFGIMLLGLLACCVGMLVAGPVCGIGTALIYDNLLQTRGGGSGAGSSGGSDDFSGGGQPSAPPASRSSTSGDAPLSGKF